MTDPANDVIYELSDGVARVTLDRPDAANSITPDQRERLIEIFDRASADLAVRVVVLGATGKHFCTGADLRSGAATPPPAAGLPERSVGDVGRLIRRGAQRLVASVMDCEKPVIAAVNGTAAGLGVHLALACDLVVAADTARFIEVFVRRGITPDGGGAYLITRRIGLAKAKELMFFGDDLPAVEAARLGLINRAVPADELAAAVDGWAARLAVAPTKAVALTKWMLDRAASSDRGAAFDDEAVAQELASHTDDFREGVSAFVERREARFSGW